MYKQNIVELIKDIDQDMKVDKSVMNQDLRTLGMDSIVFIRFMAQIEEKFDIEFEYDFLDKHKSISVEVLNGIITEKHMK